MINVDLILPNTQTNENVPICFNYALQCEERKNEFLTLIHLSGNKKKIDKNAQVVLRFWLPQLCDSTTHFPKNKISLNANSMESKFYWFCLQDPQCLNAYMHIFFYIFTSEEMCSTWKYCAEHLLILIHFPRSKIMFIQI